MAFLGFNELAGSPVRDITPVGQRAQRMAIIEQSLLDDLITYLFPLGDFGRAYPGNAALRASNMHVEPWGGEASKIASPIASNLDVDAINTYAYLKVTVDYETIQADISQGDDPQLLLNHRWSIGGEFLTVEAKGLEWSDEGLVDDDVKAGILIPTIEHQITWMRVERPPFTAMRDRLGCVNSANQNFQTGTILPETLLFLGAELHRDILTSGALAWQVGYHFSERRVAMATDLAPGDHGNKVGGVSGGAAMSVGGWNHFFRSEDEDSPRVEGKSGWYRLRVKSDDSMIFRLKSFTELFQQAP